MFSGKSRKGSVSHWCKKLAKRLSITVEVEMIDIKVKPHHDLTKECQTALDTKASNKVISCSHFFTALFNIQQQSTLVEQEGSEASSLVRLSKGTSTFDMART